MHRGVAEAMELMGLIADEAAGCEDGVGKLLSAKSTFAGECAIGVLHN